MIIDNLTTSLSTVGAADTALSGLTASIDEKNAHEEILSANILATSISGAATTTTCLPNNNNDTSKNVGLAKECIKAYPDDKQDELAYLIDEKIKKSDQENKPLSLVKKPQE